LESVKRASTAQSKASNALVKAADVLAEKEKKLATALGLSSIEELKYSSISTRSGGRGTSSIQSGGISKRRQCRPRQQTNRLRLRPC